MYVRMFIYIYIMWYTSGACCFHPETSSQFYLQICLFSPRVVQSILCEIFLLSILSKHFFEIKESFKHSLMLQSLLRVVGDRAPKQNTETSQGIWSTRVH